MLAGPSRTLSTKVLVFAFLGPLGGGLGRALFFQKKVLYIALSHGSQNLLNHLGLQIQQAEKAPRSEESSSASIRFAMHSMTTAWTQYSYMGAAVKVRAGAETMYSVRNNCSAYIAAGAPAPDSFTEVCSALVWKGAQVCDIRLQDRRCVGHGRSWSSVFVHGIQRCIGHNVRWSGILGHGIKFDVLHHDKWREARQGESTPPSSTPESPPRSQGERNAEPVPEQLETMSNISMHPPYGGTHS